MKKTTYVRKDNIYRGLVNAHKRGELSTDEYWDAVVNRTGDGDLPGSVQKELERAANY